MRYLLLQHLTTLQKVKDLNKMKTYLNIILLIFLAKDVDECVLETDECAPKDQSVCTNNIGSYSCECRKGFIGDGRNCTSELLF